MPGRNINVARTTSKRTASSPTGRNEKRLTHVLITVKARSRSFASVRAVRRTGPLRSTERPIHRYASAAVIYRSAYVSQNSIRNLLIASSLRVSGARARAHVHACGVHLSTDVSIKHALSFPVVTYLRMYSETSVFRETLVSVVRRTVVSQYAIKESRALVKI